MAVFMGLGSISGPGSGNLGFWDLEAGNLGFWDLEGGNLGFWDLGAGSGVLGSVLGGLIY